MRVDCHITYTCTRNFRYLLYYYIPLDREYFHRPVCFFPSAMARTYVVHVGKMCNHNQSTTKTVVVDSCWLINQLTDSIDQLFRIYRVPTLLVTIIHSLVIFRRLQRMEVHRKWRRYVTVTGSNAWRYNYIIFNEFSSCQESLSLLFKICHPFIIFFF